MPGAFAFAAMQVEDKNYYELLGVPRDAKVEDIKRAYRDLSRIFHPDSNFYSDLIQDKITDKHLAIFKLLTLAYNTLTSEESRQRYDATLLSGILKDWDAIELTDTPPYHATQFHAASKPAKQNFTMKSYDRPNGFGSQPPSAQNEPLVDSPNMQPVSHFLKKKGVISKFFAKILKRTPARSR